MYSIFWKIRLEEYRICCLLLKNGFSNFYPLAGWDEILYLIKKVLILFCICIFVLKCNDIERDVDNLVSISGKGTVNRLSWIKHELCEWFEPTIYTETRMNFKLHQTYLHRRLFLQQYWSYTKTPTAGGERLLVLGKYKPGCPTVHQNEKSKQFLRRADRWWNTTHSSHDASKMNKSLHVQLLCFRQESMLQPRFTKPMFLQISFATQDGVTHEESIIIFQTAGPLALPHWRLCFGRKRRQEIPELSEEIQPQNTTQREMLRSQLDPATGSAQQIHAQHRARQEFMCCKWKRFNLR